eukprot:1153762-Pelagomonas_calceolata.AAC.1
MGVAWVTHGCCMGVAWVLAMEWTTGVQLRSANMRTCCECAQRLLVKHTHTQVLTMEWIDGVRLRSASSAERMEAVMRRAQGGSGSSSSSSSSPGLRGSEEDLALVEVSCSVVGRCGRAGTPEVDQGFVDVSCGAVHQRVRAGTPAFGQGWICLRGGLWYGGRERAQNFSRQNAGVRCSLEQMLEDGFYHADPGVLQEMYLVLDRSLHPVLQEMHLDAS